MNGDNATDEQLLWGSGHPDNSGNNEDCVEILVPPPFNETSNDYRCNVPIIGLCENTV